MKFSIKSNYNYYKDNGKDRFTEIITRHWNEVMVSNNFSAKRNRDVYVLKNKCKGAIVTTNMAVTLASFFNNNTKHDEYVVYAGYLIPEENETLHVYEVDRFYLHPYFIMENKTNDVGVVKVKSHFLLNTLGFTAAMLPNKPMDFKATKETICTLLYYQRSSGADTLRSVLVSLLTKEECADLILLNNLTLPLHTSSFCVKARTSLYKSTDITKGAACVCNSVVRGIITNSYRDVKMEYPLPVLDIGLHTNWIRATIVNLNQVYAAAFLNCVTAKLLISCLGILLWQSK